MEYRHSPAIRSTRRRKCIDGSFVWFLAVTVTMVIAPQVFAGPPAPSGTGSVERFVVNPITVELYARSGCSRCDAARKFLDELARRRPDIRIVERFIDDDPALRRKLASRLEAAGVTTPGVPVIAIGDHIIVGFDDATTTGERVVALLDASRTPRSAAPAEARPQPDASAVCSVEEEGGACPSEQGMPGDEVDTRLFGPLSVSRIGLPLFTIALGLLDGFNPCAMWVLVFLLAMLAGQRDRGRMAVTAGTFVLTSGVVYYAFMTAWLNVFLVLGASRAIQVVLGLVALAMGALNTKDFFAFRRGPSLSIPEQAKPHIYARVRSILRADSLAASALGVVVLAVLVNFVELLCTAGLPAVYTAILARQSLSPWVRSAYLGLYNLAYIADDTLMVTIAVITLSRRKLSVAAGRWLKLSSGVVMLGLGLALLFRPEWLA